MREGYLLEQRDRDGRRHRHDQRARQRSDQHDHVRALAQNSLTRARIESPA